MEYRKMLAVTGMSGLFELISSKNDGAIIKSLEDGNTRFVSSRKHQFSQLESIEIYTTRDNVNLVEIFQAMEAANRDLPDAKDPKATRQYFESVYPDLDFERVYASDMRKMVRWYQQLKAAGVKLELSREEEKNENEAIKSPEDAASE